MWSARDGVSSTPSHMKAALFLTWAGFTAAIATSQPVPEAPALVVNDGADQQQANKINEAIYQAVGFGNTYLVTTSEGNVIIDTSMPMPARRHVKLLKAVSNGPVKYIILTHGHGDHTGGVP